MNWITYVGAKTAQFLSYADYEADRYSKPIPLWPIIIIGILVFIWICYEDAKRNRDRQIAAQNPPKPKKDCRGNVVDAVINYHAFKLQFELYILHNPKNCTDFTDCTFTYTLRDGTINKIGFTDEESIASYNRWLEEHPEYKSKFRV